MVTLLEEIKKHIQVWHEERAKRIEAERQAELDAEARRAVQVMEFNGGLFVCVNGVPLFGIDEFRVSIGEAIANGRNNYKDWKEEKLWAK